MRKVDRLFERPIAHRGLHDANAGIVENSRSAVQHAIAAGYAVEVDVQITADGEAAVFHDETLDRLTGETGFVMDRAAADLSAMPLSNSASHDRIWMLSDLLMLVAGRVPVIVEIKTQWNGDRRLAARVAELLTAYRGPVGAKSFDPDLVTAFGRAAAHIPRGIIGYAYDDEEAMQLGAGEKFWLRNLLHWPRTRPHFISWGVHDLPRKAVSVASRMSGAPIMTWTVRTPEEQARAGLYADQMIFEGFRP